MQIRRKNLSQICDLKSKKTWNLWASLRLACLLTVFTELCSRKSLISLLHFVFTKPHIFLINVLIVDLTLAPVFAVKRKKLVKYCISGLWILLGIVDFILLCFRVTPFNASDLRLTEDALRVMSKYVSLWQVLLIGAASMLVIVLIVIGFFRLPKEEQRIPLRRVIPGIIVFGFALAGGNSLATSLGVIDPAFGNLAKAYQDYGLNYCFTVSVLRKGIKKPSSYNEELVEEISLDETVPEEEVPSVQIWEGDTDLVDAQGIEVTKETPNIIFLQLESFWDITEDLSISINEDPIPYFRSLALQYSSGYLSVPAVGAGTANTEFEVNTGMNLDFFGPGEYPYKTVLQDNTCESMAFDMKELGYHAHAIHNNDGTFYDRYKVFSQLGFDTFTSLEYMSGYETTPMGWAKDDILTEQIELALSSTVGADYIYTISVQGHGSYPEEKVIEDNPFEIVGADSTAQKNQMEYYAYQINEMDQFLKKLIHMLKSRKEPTILVMYGDHLPTMDITDEQLLSRDTFKTKYVMWDNIGLKPMLKNVEAYQLASYVLERINIAHGTAMRFHQNYLKSITRGEADMESYLEDMQVLEYDMLYGDHNVYGGEMPYEASNLHMGIHKISISNVYTKSNGMYVMGWHFTPNSVIMQNGETCETTYVTPDMLYTSDYELVGEDDLVTVAQISEDNIILSETDPHGVTGSY